MARASASSIMMRMVINFLPATLNGTNIKSRLFSLVLTKVIVYAGIAILASEVIPSIFDVLGFGVKYWVDV